MIAPRPSPNLSHEFLLHAVDFTARAPVMNDDGGGWVFSLDRSGLLTIIEKGFQPFEMHGSSLSEVPLV
jgi:hypothetical protein